MKTTLCLLALLCLLGAQCDPPPQPPPAPSPAPEPVPTPDPAPVPVPPAPTGDTCDAAEANAARHGCPLVGIGSSSWADVCRNAAKNAVTMHQACVSSAKDCPAIVACLKSTK